MKVPLWKNPYLIGFLIGAVILTILPVMQRQFLKAPPPLLQLAPWELPQTGLSSSGLLGKVVLVTAVMGPCDASCVQQQRDFGAAVEHLDDLRDRTQLLTLVGSAAQAGLSELMSSASPGWRFAADADSALEPLVGQLQTGLNQFLSRPGTPFAQGKVIALVDQNGAVRGYWKGDGEGRGNSINAARLLAKHGPSP